MYLRVLRTVRQLWPSLQTWPLFIFVEVGDKLSCELDVSPCGVFQRLRRLEASNLNQCDQWQQLIEILHRYAMPCEIKIRATQKVST